MLEYTELVSVIVPVYGTELYLPDCIESICNQTYKNIQIILVDDQSPDKCPEICDEYAKKDTRIIAIHQENGGVSSARNAGLRIATGEYIMFVDSDDLLYTGAVELLLYKAKKYKADIVSAIKRVAKKTDQNNNICGTENVDVYQSDEPLLLSLEGNRHTNSACAKLFKSQLIGDIRFEEGKHIHEDGFFLFQCFLKKPVLVQLDKVVYQYNVREGSSSRQEFSDKYLSMFYFVERKKEIILEKYPHYINQFYNMEVRTNLKFLDVMCSSTDKSYNNLQKTCIDTVRKLRKHHIPINKHDKILEKIVAIGLYGIYKVAVRLKYYR